MSVNWSKRRGDEGETAADDAERSSRFVEAIELAYEIRVGDIDAGELTAFEETVLFGAWPAPGSLYPPAGHGYPRRDDPDDPPAAWHGCPRRDA
ncbi:hypothetical protein OG416_38965 [Streptomyces longwoodensis]|uniref:hypothetical protein n=1 Tax=Streptomyces longwoodensis TaxID=68231 RepID=UPI0030E32537|nr:hypothetical protein OG416_38965 [Streptomyces longwoodensis]